MTTSRKRQLAGKFVLAALAALALGAAAFQSHYQEMNRRLARIDMAAETGVEIAVVQLFYDTGRGFNQQDSQVAAIIGDGKTQTLRFKLPDKKIKQLRLDPLNVPGRVILQSCELTSFNGQFSEMIAPENITPLNQIAAMTRGEQGQWLITTTPDGNDPSLILQLSETQRTGPGLKNLKNSLSLAVRLPLMLGLGFFLILVAGGSPDALPRRENR